MGNSKDHIIYDQESLTAAASELDKIAQLLSDVKRQLDAVDTSGEWWSKVTFTGFSGSVEMVNSLRSNTQKLDSSSGALAGKVRKAVELFEQADSDTVANARSMGAGTDRQTGSAGAATGAATSGNASEEQSLWSKFTTGISDFLKAFSLGNLPKGANNLWLKLLGLAVDVGYMAEFSGNYSWGDPFRTFGDIYDVIDKMLPNKTWGGVKDFVRNNWNSLKDLSISTGNAVVQAWRTGSIACLKDPVVNWVKEVFRQPHNYTSRGTDYISRYKDYLTHTDSNYNLGTVWKDFKGANGGVKCAASWLGVAADGVFNYFNNLDEQSKSNGTMSDARVYWETGMETVVGTALNYGGTVVVGAGLAAAGAASAPVWVVGALGTAAVVGANALSTSLTGQSMTEWISDGILDLGEIVYDYGKIGCEKAGPTVCGWMDKMALAW